MTGDSTTYLLPSTDAESRRLELQAGLYGGTSWLDPFLDESPHRALDVGCGTGNFTRHVAARLPGAEVVGIDIDESRIDYARAHTEGDNPVYRRGDLLALPFEDASFDLAFCRFVLVHHSDPARAVREMSRVIRPGGRVVAYDMIHDGIWFSPPKPALARLLQITLNVLRERGADPDVGLRLPAAMKRAGLDDVRVRVIPHHAMSGEALYDACRENWLLTVDSLSGSLGSRFEPGLAERAKQELSDRGGDHFLVEVTVLAHGIRRAGF
jgi:SAM-dependent methyltransferase